MTAKVSYPEPSSDGPASLAAHVSLSLYSIVKDQTKTKFRQRITILKAQNPVPGHSHLRNHQKIFSGTSSLVASSAAALVSDRLIDPGTQNSQQQQFKKMKKSDKLLIFINISCCLAVMVRFSVY